MSINGLWYNERGSQMILVVEGCSLSGTYSTPLGDAPGTYALVGVIDPDPGPQGVVLGFVVVWTNAAQGSSGSVTAWSGQYHAGPEGERITTTWLLTSATDAGETWRSTLVGQAVFTR